MWHRQQWRTSRLVMNWRMRKTSAERFRKVTVVHSTRDFSTRFLSLPRLIRSPVLRKRSFAHNNIVSSFSSFNSLSLTSVNRHFRNFSTWSSFSPKGSVAMLISWKCPHNNMRGEKHQISPNFASNRNILSVFSRDVEGKQKIKNNSVHQLLLAYMFTKFGGGRLNSDGDRRARLNKNGKILPFLT